MLQWLQKTSAGAIKNEVISNKELAEELQNSITRKFKKRKVYSSFIDNICWSCWYAVNKQI